MPNILLGLTGSVATTVAPKLINTLAEIGTVRVILTESAREFLGVDSEPFGSERIYFDADEWRDRYKKGDPILHIELRKWADVLLIAPCSANTLAKLANGICDNLLTSVARAWNFKKPFYIAPAMNTMMWNHPVTEEHLRKIREWYIHMISPQSKMLACGDEGDGAMQEISVIASKIRSATTQPT